MPLLLLGDCLEEMKTLDDDSVDFIFCDLPYGHTSCKWDCKIDLDKFWIEIMRIKKLRTPIFMTTTTKFGVELINSAPKKCPFRYDLVWVKSHSTSFLHAKHRPMTKHELVYVFYERLPFYDLSSHKHKLSQYIGVKEDKQTNNYKAKRIIYKDENGNVIKEGQSGKNHTKYNPPSISFNTFISSSIRLLLTSCTVPSSDLKWPQVICCNLINCVSAFDVVSILPFNIASASFFICV